MERSDVLISALASWSLHHDLYGPSGSANTDFLHFVFLYKNSNAVDVVSKDGSGL
jgi:hypothetical protein